MNIRFNYSQNWNQMQGRGTVSSFSFIVAEGATRTHTN